MVGRRRAGDLSIFLFSSMACIGRYSMAYERKIDEIENLLLSNGKLVD